MVASERQRVWITLNGASFERLILLTGATQNDNDHNISHNYNSKRYVIVFTCNGIGRKISHEQRCAPLSCEVVCST